MKSKTFPPEKKNQKKKKLFPHDTPWPYDLWTVNREPLPRLPPATRATLSSRRAVAGPTFIFITISSLHAKNMAFPHLHIEFQWAAPLALPLENAALLSNPSICPFFLLLDVT